VTSGKNGTMFSMSMLGGEESRTPSFQKLLLRIRWQPNQVKIPKFEEKGEVEPTQDKLDSMAID